MPDIFKSHGNFQPSGKVKIPDAAISHPPPEPEEEEEEGTGEFVEENFTASVQHFEPLVPTREELMADMEEELEDIRTQAAAKAYSDALNAKRSELQQCMDQVNAVLSQMQQNQQEFMDQYGVELKYLAVDIAEAMILKKIQEDDMILKDLVMQTVNRIRNAEWLDVEISEQLTGLVDYLKEEFQRPQYRGKTTVTSRHLPEDTVRVDNQDGSVIATISTQADRLRAAFRDSETGLI